MFCFVCLCLAFVYLSCISYVVHVSRLFNFLFVYICFFFRRHGIAMFLFMLLMFRWYVNVLSVVLFIVGFILRFCVSYFTYLKCVSSCCCVVHICCLFTVGCLKICFALSVLLLFQDLVSLLFNDAWFSFIFRVCVCFCVCLFILLFKMLHVLFLYLLFSFYALSSMFYFHLCIKLFAVG